MMRCDENIVLRYGLRMLDDTEHVSVELHLAICASCRAYLQTIQIQPDIGESVLPGQTAAARALVRDILAADVRAWPARLSAYEHRLATLAGVQALIEACEAELDRTALAAAEIVSSALATCAEALPPSLQAQTLRALAWTRRGTALMRRGKLDAALLATTKAEAYAALVPAADYERALVAFTTADILRERGETEEALKRIREAGVVFASHQDLRRHASAREMEAAILYRSGAHTAAGDIFESMLTERGDPSDRGRLLANAAQCLIAGGNHERALGYLAEAEDIFRELQVPLHVARIAWGKSRVLRQLGDNSAAIDALREVLELFEILSATPEWVRAGVELVEWMLPLGDVDAVRKLCLEIYERAVQSGMRLQALEAVSYLREAALAARLVPHDAVAVRVFLDDLSSRPSAEFQPPF
jgi:tetratricopeptide (TPR) repeat protein